MSTKQKTTSTSNQTQTNAPAAWAQPGLEQLGARVTAGIGGLPRTPYGGNFVEAPDQGRTNQIIGELERVAGRARGMADFSEAQTRDMFAPRDSNGMLQAAITAAIDPTYRQLQERVLPGITNSALLSGAYSGDRATGVMPQIAIRDANENAQRIAATMGYEGFQAEENRRLERMGMLPSLTQNTMQLDASVPDLLGLAGDTDLNRRSALTQDALARHQYGVQQPFEGMDIATNLLTQLSGNWGTQTGSSRGTQTQSTSGLGPILQGALGLGMAAAGAPPGLFRGAGNMAGAAKVGGGSTGGGFNPFSYIQQPGGASAIFGRGG